MCRPESGTIYWGPHRFSVSRQQIRRPIAPLLRAAVGVRLQEHQRKHHDPGRRVPFASCLLHGSISASSAARACGCTSTNGERYLDFIERHRGERARPRASAPRRRPLPDQATKLLHVSNLFRIPEGEALAARLCEVSFADWRVLRQFRRGSDGRRHQAGAQISRRRRASPIADRIITFEGALPRPHAGDARGRRQREISRRLRPAGRRLRPGRRSAISKRSRRRRSRRPPRS